MNRPFSKKHLHSKAPRPFFASFYGNDPAAANEKHPSPHKKEAALRRKENFKFTRRLPSPATIFSFSFYKRLKISSFVFYFPFFPFLCRSHFHRLPIFIFHFRKCRFLHSIHRTIHIASPLFTGFCEVIHLIHSLMHVFPTFAGGCGRISKFRLFHRICCRLSLLCTIPLPFSLILIHDFT